MQKILLILEMRLLRLLLFLKMLILENQNIWITRYKMKATIVLIADNAAENYGRKMMLEAHRYGKMGFEMARLAARKQIPKRKAMIPLCWINWI